VSRIAQEGERLCRRIRFSPERPPLSRISTGASGLAAPARMSPRNLRVAWRIERIEWWTAECSRHANEVKVDLAIVNSPTDRPARPGTSTFASCVSRPSNSKADRSDTGELPMNFLVVFQIARQISSSNVRHRRGISHIVGPDARVGRNGRCRERRLPAHCGGTPAALMIRFHVWTSVPSRGSAAGGGRSSPTGVMLGSAKTVDKGRVLERLLQGFNERIHNRFRCVARRLRPVPRAAPCLLGVDRF
jgi:hypothetical protein